MDHNDLRELLVSADARTIVRLIANNKQGIRELFNTVDGDRQVLKSMETVLLRISGSDISTELRRSEEVQSLLTYLSFYFKKAKKFHYVETCHNFLNDSVYKKRIDAWLHYQRYKSPQEHVSQFDRYIEKLSSARYEEGGDITFELLQDLEAYRDDAFTVLVEPYRSTLDKCFTDGRLLIKFSLFEEYLNQQIHSISTLVIREYKSKEYEPSIFSEEIFEKAFLNHIRHHSPNYPKLIMGYDSETITKSIIMQGQADFDAPSPSHNLTSSDIVKLYCFFNMRMHYFTSLSIYERSQIVEKYNEIKGQIKFVDIGCGPGTSGLAFTEHMFDVTGRQATFDYYGIDCSMSMMEMARFIMNNSGFQENNHLGFYRDIHDIDLGDFSNASCIIVNACYLFASNTLDVTVLSDFIHRLGQAYPRCPKFLFFQNPAYDLLNIKYEQFKRQIPGCKTLFSEVEVVRYHTKRNAFTAAKKRSVYFEVLEL